MKFIKMEIPKELFWVGSQNTGGFVPYVSENARIEATGYSQIYFFPEPKDNEEENRKCISRCRKLGKK